MSLLDDLEEILDAEDFVQIEHLGGFVRGLHPDADEAEQERIVRSIARDFAASHDLVLVEMPWPPDVSEARPLTWSTPLVVAFDDPSPDGGGIQALLRRELT